MIRKLILPALAAAMLAGCATYQYRGGAGGDYYYDQPATEYRYYGSPYGYYGGYGYGYPYGGSIGYGYYRSYPGWYGYPRHSGGHSHGHHGPRPGGDGDHDDDQGGNPQNQQPDQPRPPWRDLGRLDPSQRAHVEAKRPVPMAEREASSPVRRATPGPLGLDRPRARRPKRDGDPVSPP